MLCSKECLHVPICVQFFTLNQSFSQIWVRNVKTSKTYHVSISTLDFSNSCFWVELFIGDYDSFEMWSKGFGNVRNLLLRCFKVLLFTVIYFIWLPDFNKTNRFFAEPLAKVTVSFDWVQVIHIIEPGYWRDLNTDLPWFKILQDDVNQLKSKSASILCWTSIIIWSFVGLWSYKWIDQVPMCTVQLNSIKVALFCEFYAFSEVLFGLFDVFDSHGFWNLMGNVETSMIVTNCNIWRTKWMKSSRGFGHACAAAVKDLKEEFRVFGMDGIDDLFPRFSMLLIIQTSGTWKALSPLAPWYSFSQYHCGSGSLGVVID